MKNKNLTTTKYLLISLLVVLLLSSTTFIVGAKNLSPKDKGWKLQWSDEFDGKELNQDVWTYDIGTGFSGWGNHLNWRAKKNKVISPLWVSIIQ